VRSPPTDRVFKAEILEEGRVVTYDIERVALRLDSFGLRTIREEPKCF